MSRFQPITRMIAKSLWQIESDPPADPQARKAAWRLVRADYMAKARRLERKLRAQGVDLVVLDD